MPTSLRKLEQRARALQEQIDAELRRRREALGVQIRRGRIGFSEELRRRHRAARISLRAFLGAARPMVLLTAPVIYGLIVPMLILDLAVTLYMWICFPVYGIARVRRRDYILIDRHHLAYLNGLQKLNCVYCGYGNGLFAFVHEVAGRTEAYWCPIKHASRVRAPHSQYSGFLDYGEEEDFIARWQAKREQLKSLE